MFSKQGVFVIKGLGLNDTQGQKLFIIGEKYRIVMALNRDTYFHFCVIEPEKKNIVSTWFKVQIFIDNFVDFNLPLQLTLVRVLLDCILRPTIRLLQSI